MSHFNYQNMTKTMRIVGASALLLSGAIFLYQGLRSFDDFNRFLTFSAMTFAISLLGYFCARFLNEPKGARTFLTLGAAAVPALFAQLGAMVYGWSQGTVTRIPDMFKVVVSEPTQIGIAALINIGLGFLISIPIFTILDRKSKKATVPLYIFLNCLLVIPLRGPYETLAIMSLVACSFYFLHQRFQMMDPMQLTREKLGLLALFIIPATIVLFRSYFYTNALLMVGSTFVLAAVISTILTRFYHLRLIERFTKENKMELLPPLYQKAPVLFATLSLIFLIEGLNSDLMLKADTYVILFINLCLIHGMLKWVTYKKYLPTNSKAITVLWSLGGFFLFVQAILSWSYWAGFILLAAGTLGIIEGYANRWIISFRAGVILLITGIVMNISLALQHVNISYWLNFAVLGGVIILMASVLEKKGHSFKMKYEKMRNHFQ